jgi:DNA-binding CsgD family transcriptional regulator
LVDILQKVKTRIWVPNQAALEYQQNRLEVISTQRDAYDKIEHSLRDTSKKLESELKGYSRHPLINVSEVLAPIETVFANQIKGLEAVRKRHPDLLDNDEIRETLTELLDGHVGPPYPKDRLSQIRKEGEERYAKLIPPGYGDAKSKTNDREYGDLVLWYQVIDKATEEKRPVVLVTDDVKEDWWWKHHGKTVGPKPELREELLLKAEVGFYMYNSDQFMEYARRFLKEHVDQDAIDEVREIRKQDEELRLAMEMDAALEVDQRQQERNALELELINIDADLASISSQWEKVSRESQDGPSKPEAFLVELDSRRRLLIDRASILRSHLHDLDATLDSKFLTKRPLALLSPREKEVVKCVASGLTNDEIAMGLNISVHTVRNYLFRIFDKLRLSSRADLVRYARSANLA